MSFFSAGAPQKSSTLTPKKRRGKKLKRNKRKKTSHQLAMPV